MRQDVNFDTTLSQATLPTTPQDPDDGAKGGCFPLSTGTFELGPFLLRRKQAEWITTPVQHHVTELEDWIAAGDQANWSVAYPIYHRRRD